MKKLLIKYSPSIYGGFLWGASYNLWNSWIIAAFVFSSGFGTYLLTLWSMGL